MPDPKHPRLFGGSDHHTDPGPHWRWGYYMNLVRRFAFPERYALHVDTTSIERGPIADRASSRGAVRTKGAVRAASTS